MKKIVLSEGTEISTKSKPFFIGEIGINHNGSIAIAKKLIDMASEVGIDSVKFQKRNYLETITKSMLHKNYEHQNSFGKTYLEHKEKLEFSNDQLKELFSYAKKKKLIPCCSGFDILSYEFIENELNPLFHKIPSPLIVNHEILERVAEFNKPIFVATGMSTMREIEMAVKVLKRKNNKLVLMQCTSLYPTENDEVDLLVIKTFRERFNTLVGFSSHDKSVVFPSVAFAFGAVVFEKHITLDRAMKGPDHSSSFEKRGLELAYNYLIATSDAMGNGLKKVHLREKDSRNKHLQSIVASRNIRAGEKIQRADLKFKSPGKGLLPYEIKKVLGKKLRLEVQTDEIIKLSYLE